MKKIKEAVKDLSEKFTKEPKGDPPNPEFEGQKKIRERKENPTVREGFEKTSHDLTKDFPNP